MNVYVNVDIEGISGVYTREQVLPEEPRFNEGRRLMTQDVNAVAKGLKEAGVDKVYVCDTHGGSYSLIWEDVSDDVDYCVCGDTAESRYLGIEDCDAVILLGYHAMAGTHCAILEHSWSSKSVQNVWINSKKVGEIAMDAAVAGEHGKPIIMISGDDKAIAEAKDVIPHVICAEVKKGCAIGGGILLPPTKAHELIKEKAKEAVKLFEEKKYDLFTFEKPLDCKIEYTERTILPNTNKMPYVKIIDGRTVSVDADSTEEFISKLC